MGVIMTALVEEGRYDVVSPEPASYKDLARAHNQTHITNVAKDTRLFKMASLAAGGAMLASEIACKGEPAFACIRPQRIGKSANQQMGKPKAELAFKLLPHDQQPSDYDWLNIDCGSVRVGKVRGLIDRKGLTIYSINIFPEFEGHGYARETIDGRL